MVVVEAWLAVVEELVEVDVAEATWTMEVG